MHVKSLSGVMRRLKSITRNKQKQHISIMCLYIVFHHFHDLTGALLITSSFSAMV